MIRLLIYAGIAIVTWRLATGRWPWEHLALTRRSGPASIERTHARTLLGVGEGASREDILEAHKKLIAVVHPDRGGTSDQVHEANNARDVLLAQAAPRNPERP